MISFPKLGDLGRLGNQLFQYAYIRSRAEELGVKFYVPPWEGDDLFHLNDSHLRAPAPSGIVHKLKWDKYGIIDYQEAAARISDSTEVEGYFLTEKYFIHPADVLRWYSFNHERFSQLLAKYSDIDFPNTVSVHLRFGDMLRVPRIFLPKPSYYRKAIGLVKPSLSLVVFSDDESRAKQYLTKINSPVIYISGNSAAEDMYLMTLCRDNICSISTLSWWGAWLNPHNDKKVIHPDQKYQVGAPAQNNDLWPNTWTPCDAGRRFWNHYLFAVARLSFRRR